jgi:hypothetical protein
MGSPLATALRGSAPLTARPALAALNSAENSTEGQRVRRDVSAVAMGLDHGELEDERDAREWPWSGRLRVPGAWA